MLFSVSLIGKKSSEKPHFYSQENPEFSGVENEYLGPEGILEIIQLKKPHLITEETEAQEVSTVSSRDHGYNLINGKVSADLEFGNS